MIFRHNLLHATVAFPHQNGGRPGHPTTHDYLQNLAAILGDDKQNKKTTDSKFKKLLPHTVRQEVAS